MLRFFLHAWLCSHCLAAPLLLTLDAEPIDQIPIHENGCGPIAQLNAYRFSSREWRITTDKLRGSATEQFSNLTRNYGRHISPHAYGHFRWNEASGMVPRDLLDFINVFHKKVKLPTLSFSELFLKTGEGHQQLSTRARKNIEKSLAHGFPPILSITRFAKIRTLSGGYRWAQVSSHFVTILAMSPDNESPGTIGLTYLDPWGGRKLHGTLRAPIGVFYAVNISSRHRPKMRKNPCLVADFPDSHVGISRLAHDTPNALIAGQLIFAHKAPLPQQP